MPLSIFDLPNHNPWWKDPKAISKDLNIKAFEDSSIHWRPGIWRYIILDTPGYNFYSIRGPRQVGKTTSIKLRIRDLLDSGTSPQTIFFWPCDEIRDSRELTKLIELFLSNPFEKESNRRFIFLDEITSVKNWQTSIKYLRDAGKLENTTLVLSGSHALDIKMKFGELTGRTGRNDPDCHKMLVPMKFSEFVSCASPNLWNQVKKAGLDEGSKRRQILLDFLYGRENKVDLTIPMLKRDLDPLLEKYMACGGISRAIDEYISKGTISRGTIDTYIQALRSDLNHWNKDNLTAKLLVNSLVKRMSSEASWNDIANEIGSTQPTVTDYVETLEQCFTTTYFYHTSNTKTPKPDTRKNKKIYFEDPFIFHCLRTWTTPESSDQPFDQIISFLKDDTRRGQLIENIVANHLVRLQFNLKPHSEFSYNSNIFYSTISGKREIDFVFYHQGKCSPIEVKFRNTTTMRDLDFALKIATENDSRAVLITKDEMEITEKYVKIPASVFLFLI